MLIHMRKKTKVPAINWCNATALQSLSASFTFCLAIASEIWGREMAPNDRYGISTSAAMLVAIVNTPAKRKPVLPATKNLLSMGMTLPAKAAVIINKV